MKFQLLLSLLVGTEGGQVATMKSMLLNRDNIHTIFAVIIIFALIYALLSWTCASLPFSYFYKNNKGIQDQEENSRLQNELATHYLRSVQTNFSDQ